MSIYVDWRCRLAPKVIVLCICNFACTNVHLKPFYVHENDCMQILNLWSPVQNQKFLFQVWSLECAEVNSKYFPVDNKNTKNRCEICSTLTIKASE